MKHLTDLYIKYVNYNDNKAFENLYNQLKKLLTKEFKSNNFFTNIERADDFDDVFQETMIKLVTKKDKFDQSKPIYPYVRMMFNNNLIDYVKKRRNKAIYIGGDFDR